MTITIPRLFFPFQSVPAISSSSSDDDISDVHAVLLIAVFLCIDLLHRGLDVFR
jgi:hypothetical protein